MPQSGARLPRAAPQHVDTPEKLTAFLNAFITTIELRLQALERPLLTPSQPVVGEEVYQMANATEKRTLDVSTATLPDVANVLATFFEDLFNEKRIQ